MLKQFQDYSLSLNLKQAWNDPRLKHKVPKKMEEIERKKTTYEPLQSFKFNEAWKKIWLPDTFFRNEKKASYVFC